MKNDGFVKTIKVLKDTNENLVIGENKNIVLEGNEKTITSLDYIKPVLTVEGKATFKNINLLGECKSKIPSIDIKRLAKLDIENVLVNRKSNEEFSTETISVNGILNVKSSKVYNERTIAIYVYSSEDIEVTILGSSEIYSKEDYAIFNSGKGKVTIQGGEFKTDGRTIICNQKDGYLTINSGVIKSDQGRAIENAGKLIISGTAELSTGDSQTIYNINTGVVVITGGNIKSTAAITIDNKEGGQLTISGGTVLSEAGNAICNQGILNINQGANILANSDNYATIYNLDPGTIEVNGGIVQNTANNYDIYNNGGKVEDKNEIIVKNNWKNQ